MTSIDLKEIIIEKISSAVGEKEGGPLIPLSLLPSADIITNKWVHRKYSFCYEATFCKKRVQSIPLTLCIYDLLLQMCAYFLHIVAIWIVQNGSASNCTLSRFTLLFHLLRELLFQILHCPRWQILHWLHSLQWQILQQTPFLETYREFIRWALDVLSIEITPQSRCQKERCCCWGYGGTD